MLVVRVWLTQRFLKACPEAHSDTLAYPLCNRLFIGPKLWVGLANGVCFLPVFMVKPLLSYWFLFYVGVGGFLNARPSG